MPWCPECRTEYEAGVTECADCGVALVEALPREDADEPVVALHAATANEAQVAVATLQAEGIQAYVPPPTFVLPQQDDVVNDVAPELDVLVPPEEAGHAREVLDAPPPSEEELAALQEQEGIEPPPGV